MNAAPRAPDFFIVGHPKSGTTALYELLRQHPGIFMPESKEIQFLAADLPLCPRPGNRLPPLPRTIEEYFSLFDNGGGRRVGEASALYLTSSVAASSIRELNPDARIIAIFREPAEFLRSLHLQLRQSRLEDQADFGRALALEDSRREGRHIPRLCFRPAVLLYSQHVRYTEQLRRYRDAFDRDQILVLAYEDFRTDNAAILREVLRFLALDESISVRPVEANPTVWVRSRLLDELVRRASIGVGPFSSAVKAGVKATVPRSTRRTLVNAVQARNVQETVPAADESLMARLRQLFKPEVELFSEYLGRDLVTLWGYDRL